jgi:hypothetical protein
MNKSRHNRAVSRQGAQLNDWVGENIRKIRKAKGLGQIDLVRMLQIDGIEDTQ